MATVTTQGAVIMNVPTLAPSNKLKEYRKIMLGLSVTETVLGSISVLLGIVISASRSSYYYGYYSSITSVGEGMWCGVWVLVAGILGIAASRTTRKESLIHWHMGFAITGAVFSSAQVTASTILALVYSRPFETGLSIIVAVIGFIAFIICIVSASYCCSLYTALTGAPSCCGQGCCSEGCCGEQVAVTHQPGQRVVYIHQPNQQPQYYPGVQHTQTIIQGPGGQQFVTHPYPVTSIPGQPAMVMQQGMVMQNPQTTVMPQANIANPQTSASGPAYTN
uniref:Uncharacterized protein n=1 Tax=Ciona savignyi TaxID=51511 RepID=H2YGQ1_CIOSA